MTNDQHQKWSSEFGDEYTSRNDLTQEQLEALYIKNFGISRTELNKEFLHNLDKEMKILEVGCNTGMQLINLRNLGFKNLFGIDISKAGLMTAKKNIPEAHFLEASALDLPFKDNFFDLIFTSGVLMHIHPENLVKAINEIYRVSKKYIWVYEYFAENCEEIMYRGNKNLLWKNNFKKLFLGKCNNLKIIKERNLRYLDNNNIDHMFLLEKS